MCHPACLSLSLPETNILFLFFVCLFVCRVFCMNAVMHIPATTPTPFILFSFSHPRLPLISHVFSISRPFSIHSLSPPSLAANPLLLPSLHPLLPEGFEKVLHNALQIITMHTLWIWGDTAAIKGFDKGWTNGWMIPIPSSADYVGQYIMFMVIKMKENCTVSCLVCPCICANLRNWVIPHLSSKVLITTGWLWWHMTVVLTLSLPCHFLV